VHVQVHYLANLPHVPFIFGCVFHHPFDLGFNSVIPTFFIMCEINPLIKWESPSNIAPLVISKLDDVMDDAFAFIVFEIVFHAGFTNLHAISFLTF
jgi:hypothetical protein